MHPGCHVADPLTRGRKEANAGRAPLKPGQSTSPGERQSQRLRIRRRSRRMANMPAAQVLGNAWVLTTICVMIAMSLPAVRRRRPCRCDPFARDRSKAVHWYLSCADACCGPRRAMSRLSRPSLCTFLQWKSRYVKALRPACLSRQRRSLMGYRMSVQECLRVCKDHGASVI